MLYIYPARCPCPTFSLQEVATLAVSGSDAVNTEGQKQTCMINYVFANQTKEHIFQQSLFCSSSIHEMLT